MMKLTIDVKIWGAIIGAIYSRGAKLNITCLVITLKWVENCLLAAHI